MGNKNISITIETITPEKASEYLKHNTMNRPLDGNRVNLYVHEMKAGKWKQNIAEPIAFAEDGTLINGQHRLQAVIKSAMAIEMGVVRGANKGDFVAIDAGKVRGGSDVLALKGYANFKSVASIVNFLLSVLRRGLAPDYTKGSPEKRTLTFVTNEDILYEYNTSPELYQIIINLASREYKKYRLYTIAQLGGICAYLVKDKHYDIAKVEEFYVALNDGAEYEYLGSLRKKIIRSMTRTSDKDKISASAKLVMLSKAWNYFIAGEDRKVIPYKIGEKMQFD